MGRIAFGRISGSRGFTSWSFATALLLVSIPAAARAQNDVMVVPPHATPAPAATPAAPRPATAGAADPAQTLPAAKVAELQARFKQGAALQGDGKWKEARDVYDGILAEQPAARGSLLYAGICSNRLGEFTKAVEYLDRFRALEPKDPQGLIQSIQAAQGLKKVPKVEGLRRELYALRDQLVKSPPPNPSHPTEEFIKDPMYVRERIADPVNKDGWVDISEAFDYKAPPNAVYMAQQFLPSGEKGRQLFVSYEKIAADQLKGKDARATDAEVFFFVEVFPAATNENEQADVTKQQLTKPDYGVAKQWIVERLRTPAKRTAAPASAPATSPTVPAKP